VFEGVKYTYEQLYSYDKSTILLLPNKLLVLIKASIKREVDTVSTHQQDWQSQTRTGV